MKSRLFIAISICLVGLFISTIGFAREVLFSEPQHFSVGNYPYFVTTADLNGDGSLDIVTANAGIWSDGTWNVSILLGNGDGTFQDQYLLPASGFPRWVTIGDVNNDGNLDLAITNRAGYYGGGLAGSVWLYLGRGDGTFAFHSVPYQGTYDSQPMSSDLRDLNHDGKLDLVVAIHGENRVAVLLGNGDGTFQPLQYYGVGVGPQCLVIADFNNDHNPDIAVSNWWSNTVSVLLGNGNGTFQTHQEFPIGQRSNAIAVGDLNGDNMLDIVAANAYPYQPQFLSILFGNGDGTFKPQINLTTKPELYGVAVADINYDGNLDIVTANSRLGDDSVSIFYGNGDGSFQEPKDFFTGYYSSPMWVAIADLNNDGVTDILTANQFGQNVSVLLGYEPNHPPVANAGGPYSVAEGSDVTLDGSGSSDPDPGDAITLYEWDFDYDGVDFTVDASSPTLFHPWHTYLDGPVSKTVALRVTDTKGSLSPISTATVLVNNVPPAVSTITAPLDPVQTNTSINTHASFTDPGVLDTHTAVWDWGDGSTSAGVVNETTGAVSGSHTYTSPGVYTLTLTVTDKDGGFGRSVFHYVVIYDPEGGFVTGGGWINSPAGAYAQDPSLSGKATFGFVSKYQRGAEVPTGQTEFQFKVASLNFHSTSYDWLIIAGAKAQYKGSGTINGSGDYRFMLTGIDGQINGGGGVDKFRIKIWEKATDAIIYDNQIGADITADPTTAIAGGSIVIHKQ